MVKTGRQYRQERDEWQAKVAEIEAPLRDEIQRLRGALAEAADDIASWGAYAAQCFQDKWDLEGDVKRYRDLSQGRGGSGG